MIKILIDTNIILDIVLKRKPFFIESARIFEKIDDKLVEGSVTATSITDLYYIASKQTDKTQAKNFLIDLIQVVNIIGIDKEIVVEAIESDMKDFEDAIQSFAAEYNELEFIVTRNVNDFIGSNIEAIEPKELLNRL
jgi:predicted nucleic acid-binding protein